MGCGTIDRTAARPTDRTVSSRPVLRLTLCFTLDPLKGLFSVPNYEYLSLRAFITSGEQLRDKENLFLSERKLGVLVITLYYPHRPS